MKTKKLSFFLALVTSVGISWGAVPNDQFRFKSNQDGSSVGLAQMSNQQTLEYSLDGVSWNSMTAETSFSLGKDVILYIRGKLTGNNSSTAYTQFAITGSVEVNGNLNYIWNYENLSAPLKTWCGCNLFKDCLGLTSAKNLELPATILTSECYHGMFWGCTGLVDAPSLPAVELAYHCYVSMFRNCTSLVSAPSLPATKLANYCYTAMFQGCTALKNVSSLPATITTVYCYQDMFSGCTSLVTAPQLPATTLALNCYKRMFYQCKSLVNAPELPATTLSEGCYHTMFMGCTSLKKAPKLPAKILAINCYRGMFQECSALETISSLPAEILADTCYRSMFYQCTSLKTAPTLPAQTLTNQCYYSMFSGCSKLNQIRCFAKNISASQCTSGWLSGVSSSGSFVKHSNMSGWNIGVSGIPSGWTTTNITPYRISFDANGGVLPKDGSFGKNPSLTDVSWLSEDCSTGGILVYQNSIAYNQLRNDCPTRAGHSFLGWYTAKKDGTQVYDNSGIYKVGTYWDSTGKWIGKADLQLYAQWSVNSYTITWLQDDGSLIDKTSVSYGQIPTHVAPTKEPTAEYTYSFAGWAPAVVAATENATYIATYTAQKIPTSLNGIEEPLRDSKFFHNGQLYILRDGKTYTATGQEVR